MIAIADSIISPFGFGSAINFAAVLQGKTAQKTHQKFDLPEPFFAALIENDWLDEQFLPLCKNLQHYTKLEKLAILSIHKAIEEANIDVSQKDVLFIISTTKGNVELLENNTQFEKERVYLWHTANMISHFFNNPNPPLVVSNACISGLAAQIYVQRMLQNKEYKYIIVVGVDVLSKFIVSGFQSFKALSTQCCKPFDSQRDGLNLGEAAACIIYTSQMNGNGKWKFCNGHIANDANHISGPSRTAEGLFLALNKTLQDCSIENLAFINAHGTGTRYNDDMESIAIHKANLTNIPTNSLKAHFGHTLGAAGVLECIISSYALKQHIVLPSKGFEVDGTIQHINISRKCVETHKNMFLKFLSGFGGCNAVGLLQTC